MEKKEFSGVQDTLFIPLAARVAVSERFPEYFYDARSMEFRDLAEVRAINGKSSEYSSIASVARYYNTDRFILEFLDRHPDGTVVNLGAGLDTVNWRLGRPDVKICSVDFPEVIALRQKILGRAENETLIGCDITDLPAWTGSLDPEKPVLLILSGVLQYFKPEAVSGFLRGLKAVLRNAEMVFDATDEVGIRYAERYVKKSGNTAAMMYFYVNDPEQFARDNDVALLEVRGFYDDARRMIGKKTGLYTRIAMKVADEKKRTLLLRIRLNAEAAQSGEA